MATHKTLTSLLVGATIAITIPTTTQAGFFSSNSNSKKFSFGSLFGGSGSILGGGGELISGSGNLLGNTGNGIIDNNRDPELKKPGMDMHMGGNTFSIGGDDSGAYCEKDENDKSRWYTMDFSMQFGPFEMCYEHDMRDPGGSLYMGFGFLEGIGSINRDKKERGKLSGIIFLDSSYNDEFDMDDKRLANVEVKITDSKNRVQIVKTDDKGSYKADDIAPGKTKIEMISSNNYVPILGDDIIEADVGACGTLCVTPMGFMECTF